MDAAVQLREEGFFIAKGILSADVIAACKTAMTRQTDTLLADHHQHQEAPFESRLMAAFRGRESHVPGLFRAELHQHPEMFDLFLNPAVTSIIQSLLGEAEAIRLFPNYSVRPKLPETRQHNVAWHQDCGLNPDGSVNTAPLQERLHAFDLDAMINCWAPLVPATAANGCMRFIPGTHKLGPVKHVDIGKYVEDTEDGENPQKTGVFNSAIDPVLVAAHEAGTIFVEMEPGDVVFFSNMLFHSGSPNTSDGIRWSADWRFQDAARETHRPQHGHIVCCKSDPAKVAIRSPEDWVNSVLE